MTNTGTTAARTIVTVDQAAELNELFLAWHAHHNPTASAVDQRAALRAAELQSTPATVFDTMKDIFLHRS